MIIWSLCRFDQKGLLCGYLFPALSIVANEQTTTVSMHVEYIHDILYLALPSVSKSTETYHRKEGVAVTKTGICVLSPPWYFIVTAYGPILLYISQGPRNWWSVTRFINRMLTLHNGQTVSGEFRIVLPFFRMHGMEYRWWWITAAWIADKESLESFCPACHTLPSLSLYIYSMQEYRYSTVCQSIDTHSYIIMCIYIHTYTTCYIYNIC